MDITKGVAPYLILFGLISFGPLNGQFNPDSLLRVLQKQGPDTLSIKGYLELYEYYAESDSAIADTHLKRAFAIAKKQDRIAWLAEVQLQKANQAWKTGQLAKGRLALTPVKKLLQANPELEHIQATYYMESGILHYYGGLYDKSVADYLMAKRYYLAVGDSTGAMKCHTNTGMVHWAMGDHATAQPYYEAGLRYAERHRDSISIAHMAGNLGLIHRAQGQFEQALTFYQRSYELNQKLGQQFHAGINLLNIASAYSMMGNYVEALPYYRASYNTAESIDDRTGMLYTMHGIGDLYARQGLFDQAIPRLENALELAHELNLLLEVKNLYEQLAEAYENKGFYKQALEYRKEFEFWQDSLISENHRNRIEELEITYETERKEEQITLLSREKEVQQLKASRQTTVSWSLGAGLILICTIGGLLIYLLRQRLKNQQLLAQKNTALQQAAFNQKLSELKLKALQAQMNPHFVFNCLNSINLMVLKGEKESASRYLSKFSKLMRSILEHAEQGLISLEEELKLLEHYIQLETLRFKNQIHFSFDLDSDLILDQVMVPSLLLQPLVENAIWHGIMPTNKPGVIVVRAYQQDQQLRLEVEDNGIGLKTNSTTPTTSSTSNSSGFGLRLLKERLEVLEKKEAEIELQFVNLEEPDSESTGTLVRIQMPLAPFCAN